MIHIYGSHDSDCDDNDDDDDNEGDGLTVHIITREPGQEVADTYVNGNFHQELHTKKTLLNLWFAKVRQ